MLCKKVPTIYEYTGPILLSKNNTDLKFLLPQNPI